MPDFNDDGVGNLNEFKIPSSEQKVQQVPNLNEIESIQQSFERYLSDAINESNNKIYQNGKETLLVNSIKSCQFTSNDNAVVNEGAVESPIKIQDEKSTGQAQDKVETIVRVEKDYETTVPVEDEVETIVPVEDEVETTVPVEDEVETTVPVESTIRNDFIEHVENAATNEKSDELVGNPNKNEESAVSNETSPLIDSEHVHSTPSESSQVQENNPFTGDVQESILDIVPQITEPLPRSDDQPIHRASSYDTIAKVQSFKRTPSSLYEKFLDDTLFLDFPQ